MQPLRNLGLTSRRTATLAGLALACTLAAAGCGAAGPRQATVSSANANTGTGTCPSGTPTVTVGGQATVNGTPDQVTLSLGVQTQAVTASAAMADNAARAAELVGRLEKEGVAKARIQTSSFSVQPQYNSRSVITGYQVTNSLTITLDDVAAAGRVIDQSAAVAGNAIRVNGITFSFRSENKLIGEAREAAVRQAAQQAQLMATAAGSGLGALCSLRDTSSLSQPGQVEPMVGFAASATQTPLEAGTLQVTASVTAVYQLSPRASSEPAAS